MSAALPFVSVVIPMRNERDWIERCLSTVFSQNYDPLRLEVIVVDGMSDDGSYEMLQQKAAEEPRLSVLQNPKRIVPSSLNLAIAAAKGDIVARVDAHTLLEPDYLRVGVEVLGRTGADNVGGPMVKIGGGKVGDAIAAAMSSRFGIGSYFQFGSDEREADTVYMGMWPRRVFETVGLFDEELVRNQDDEFNYRIRKAGGRIICSPAMRSKYQNRQSWSALIKQFFQYGEWKVRVLQKHPTQMSVRHFVPQSFIVAVLLGLVAGLRTPIGPLLSLFLVVGYLLVMAVVAAREAKVGKLRMFFALVLIHQSWGLGFLKGALRFAPRWFGEEPPLPRLTGLRGNSR